MKYARVKIKNDGDFREITVTCKHGEAKESVMDPERMMVDSLIARTVAAEHFRTTGCECTKKLLE